ncbi:MAG: AEC family transporter [Microbacteriaceae bacterium]
MNFNSVPGVLLGFFVVGIVILIGYLARRWDVIDGSAEKVLNVAAFYLMSPALFIVVITTADIDIIFSGYMYASILGIIITVIFTAILLYLQKKHTAVGILFYTGSTVFNNSSNIGIPISLYVLGTTSYVAPIILLQLVVFSPIILIIIELIYGPKQSFAKTISKPFKNPLILSSLLGTLLLLLDIQLPAALFNPLELLGYAAIPTLLLAFGVSMSGAKPLVNTRASIKEILLVVSVKAIFMPLITVLIGIFLFDLQGTELFALALVASFPAGQTIYNYAITYDYLSTEIRDVVLISTAVSLPAVLGFTVFLT